MVVEEVEAEAEAVEEEAVEAAVAVARIPQHCESLVVLVAVHMPQHGESGAGKEGQKELVWQELLGGESGVAH